MKAAVTIVRHDDHGPIRVNRRCAVSTVMMVTRTISARVAELSVCVARSEADGRCSHESTQTNPTRIDSKHHFTLRFNSFLMRQRREKCHIDSLHSACVDSVSQTSCQDGSLDLQTAFVVKFFLLWLKNPLSLASILFGETTGR